MIFNMVVLTNNDILNDGFDTIIFSVKPRAYKQVQEYLERLEAEGLAMNMGEEYNTDMSIFKSRHSNAVKVMSV